MHTTLSSESSSLSSVAFAQFSSSRGRGCGCGENRRLLPDSGNGRPRAADAKNYEEKGTILLVSPVRRPLSGHVRPMPLVPASGTRQDRSLCYRRCAERPVRDAAVRIDADDASVAGDVAHVVVRPCGFEHASRCHFRRALAVVAGARIGTPAIAHSRLPRLPTRPPASTDVSAARPFIFRRATPERLDVFPTDTMPENRLQRLHDAGQSIWLDFIDRTILRNGDLAAPHPRRRAHRHDVEPDDLREGARRGHGVRRPDRAPRRRRSRRWSCSSSSRRRDVRDACDIFMPRATSDERRRRLRLDRGVARRGERRARHGRRSAAPLGDGRSAERDDQGARHDEGANAVRQLIASGINVNITLLFSIEAHRRVIEAYMAGLEDRVAAGKPIDRIASVASLLRQPRGHRDRQAARRARRQGVGDERDRMLALQGQGGDRERASSRTSCSASEFAVAALEGARGAGRARAAAALGEHQHEESGVPRRACTSSSSSARTR